MTAVSRSKTRIWVVPTDTAASTLVTTAPYASDNTLGYIAGEVKSYSKTGGETDVESDPVFGGYVDKEKPQTQFELGFEIVPSFEKADFWEAMVYGYDAVNAAYTTSAAAPTDRCVYIEADDGSTPQAWGFNNCNVTVLDMEHNADDNQTKNITFKFSPQDNDGKTNYLFQTAVKDTTFSGVEDLPAWSAF